MQNKFIMSLDQGTTSSRAIIFNRHGETMANILNYSYRY